MTPGKVIRKDAEGRKSLIDGANFLADCVKATLGPWGQNWILEKGNRITNDGVSIAREIELDDEIENRGVAILREAAVKTDEEVGDGTTTAITLAQAILREARTKLGTGSMVAGALTPAELLKKIDDEHKEVKQKLLDMATPITSEEAMIEVATVSVENEELGKLIGAAQWEVGAHGVLLADETTDETSSVEYVNGILLDNGFSTSVIVTNQEKESAEIAGAKVILTNLTIEKLEPLFPILKQIALSGSNKVILFARGFTENAIKECLQNRAAGFEIYPVNAPYVDQAEIMRDLQAVLGGRFINSEEDAVDTVQIQMSDVGYAEFATIERARAIISGRQDEKSVERITKRLAELQEKFDGSKSKFEKKNLERRIAQFGNGFAIVKVGAPTEKERKYLKDKADDAVNAVRHALQEGVVPGAGQALKAIAETLPDSYILRRALMAPYEQIMFTAPSKDVVIPEWVKDPVKVVRSALEKACGVSGVLATAGGAIASKRERPTFVQQVDKK